MILDFGLYNGAAVTVLTGQHENSELMPILWLVLAIYGVIVIAFLLKKGRKNGD